MIFAICAGYTLIMVAFSILAPRYAVQLPGELSELDRKDGRK